MKDLKNIHQNCTFFIFIKILISYSIFDSIEKYLDRKKLFFCEKL